MARTRSIGFIDALVLIAVPVALIGCALVGFRQAALLTLVVAIGSLVVFFIGWEKQQPALRQIMPVVVLAALACAGRMLFAVLPNIQPVTAICIIAGAVFGRRSGFMTGALAALVSNFFLGQGAWTPWQMYCWGLIGYLSALCEEHGLFKRRWALYVFGVIASFGYGFLLNTWSLIGFMQSFTWERALVIYGAGVPMDIAHSASTVGFLLILYEPWKRKLMRIRTKFAL